MSQNEVVVLKRSDMNRRRVVQRPSDVSRLLRANGFINMAPRMRRVGNWVRPVGARVGAMQARLNRRPFRTAAGRRMVARSRATMARVARDRNMLSHQLMQARWRRAVARRSGARSGGFKPMNTLKRKR